MITKIKGEYILTKTGEKAQWYHMLLWKEIPETWNRLSPNLKKKIIESGIEVPENK